MSKARKSKCFLRKEYNICQDRIYADSDGGMGAGVLLFE